MVVPLLGSVVVGKTGPIRRGCVPNDSLREPAFAPGFAGACVVVALPTQKRYIVFFLADNGGFLCYYTHTHTLSHA